MITEVYVNWGRWIADCPMQCGGALELEDGQVVMACRECRTISQIEWPKNADAIWEALSERTVPKTRNWFPEGHSLALRAGCAHGQSVGELREETAANQEG